MNESEFREFVQAFVGKSCWRVNAGVVTGSRVNVDFGKRCEKQIGKEESVGDTQRISRGHTHFKQFGGADASVVRLDTGAPVGLA